jgi:uncharacterized protein
MTRESFSANIEYFTQEGKTNLRSCLHIAFEAAVSRGIDTIVIFTGVGEGPEIAIKEFRSSETFKDIKLIAVTFPQGQRFKESAEISPERRTLFRENNVPIVRAHLPFNPIAAHYEKHGMLGQDLSLIGNVLNVFGGGMSLCVQAALMACDAGHLELGDHVISMTSDTAIIIRTAPTERLLTDLIIREILCKPLYLSIIKKEEVEGGLIIDAAADDQPLILPPE